ncbi:uncharacterized protein BT62DRAFT_920975 [Guyanagaster necrorhizus]|uniref:Protein-S-isoprenylcysteine O-methyltransferase n=1 Tax=Guyanagaster necrorhizus TaxID=856835 RepID=A0A9P7VPU7_9AGAR|nr:uncharacterized protein BT62DRAFT_920975 [Guyanagaster necrorhizus MCA 3950]KAG7444669.1 hypothetical protein BT62DRAFT_920975 [Guyanagaster necrorhizus MCA 3950]
MSSFVKIALLFSSMVSIHVGLTPPNRPPPVDVQFIPTEKGSVRTSEVVLRRILSSGGPSTYFKALFWTVCTLESILILSVSYPKSSASQLLASIFPTSITICYSTPFAVICTLITLSGGFLRVHCFRALGRFFTFELSRQENHKLITSGAYSLVRHPSYLGALLTFAGAMPLFAGPGSWIWESGILKTIWGVAGVGGWYGGIVLMLGTLMFRLKSEDEFMRREFGKEWEKWADEVPYRLIPMVY